MASIAFRITRYYMLLARHPCFEVRRTSYQGWEFGGLNLWSRGDAGEFTRETLPVRVHGYKPNGTKGVYPFIQMPGFTPTNCENPEYQDMRKDRIMYGERARARMFLPELFGGGAGWHRSRSLFMFSSANPGHTTSENISSTTEPLTQTRMACDHSIRSGRDLLPHSLDLAWAGGWWLKR
ncbi:hypothetical protein BDM02DRAFT_3130541 [Thelephora ganbajun]|uniref:Uncharacterized protein n=1 Tax=Thelephora ganbajun TaxID=370292 RepID=A0ACB6Z9I6_THEGA|nr:hypothetical protein BDM02DRAFT_3130541 [Thelephora ganbajun]